MKKFYFFVSVFVLTILIFFGFYSGLLIYSRSSSDILLKNASLFDQQVGTSWICDKLGLITYRYNNDDGVWVAMKVDSKNDSHVSDEAKVSFDEAYYAEFGGNESQSFSEAFKKNNDKEIDTAIAYIKSNKSSKEIFHSLYRTFHNGCSGAAVEYLDEIKDAFYPNTSGFRGFYVIGGQDVIGNIEVKVYAYLNDSIIELTKSTVVDQNYLKPYFEKCWEGVDFDYSYDNSCYKEAILTDNYIQGEVKKAVDGLVELFEIDI